MPLTNILGVAFAILTTNPHSLKFDAVPCTYCTNSHHWQVVEISRVSKETRVPVVIDGIAVETTLKAEPLSAVYVTNYVTDLRAAQSRARVPPLPMVPVALSIRKEPR